MNMVSGWAIAGHMDWVVNETTYSRGLARANIIRQSWNMARVTHENSSNDLVESGGLDGGSCACETFVCISSATEGIVKDLGSLSYH